MKRRTRLAVIGAGVIGRLHVETALRDAHCDVVAVSDPSPESEEFARRRGLRWFGNSRHLLEESQLDGVVIATPNSSHVEIALDCINREIPVLVEKLVADTVSDAARLVSASREHKVPVLVGHHRRHNVVVRRAKELIDDGCIGEPITVNGLYTFFKPDAYFEARWRRESGGGPVLINLIHEIDMLRFLLGEIEQVQAMTSNAHRGFEVEDTANVLLRFRGGAIGALTVSDCVASPWAWDLAAGEAAQFGRTNVNTHFLTGSEGSIALPRLDVWNYRSGKGWHEEMTVERTHLHHADPFEEQIRHFRSVITRDEVPLCSAEDALRTLSATHAVHEAARTGSTVSI
ncbi:Gfo/Idh/MocA family oxidoreductase [Paraburkholderia dipogonis]|uniref:Gfo/Idh/MocA family oxidoreductase n=1 Tax=Paraburkholderia dipogonis TaxID=1211383 RepID=A0A4Y8MGA4_9BURK|nr:Gfo/Idh/MocA family oxidoreductase [Paraburkholderia dipogonis]TFE36491.1 Gfo/Idh/MocA family oxidoreductase [Paraburkholderia dipogonis]